MLSHPCEKISISFNHTDSLDVTRGGLHLLQRLHSIYKPMSTKDRDYLQISTHYSLSTPDALEDIFYSELSTII